MIQEFSVENYLSFNERQTISFVATKDSTHLEEVTVEVKPELRLLRMAMIYGANASGKSNLLQAIQSLWMMLFKSKWVVHEPIEFYQPFTLTRDKPTRFEIIFWANGRQYQYEVIFNHIIIYEKMMYASDKGALSLLYERKDGEEIKFGDIGIKAKQRDDLNKETLRNHTVISTLDKKNIHVPDMLRGLYNWIKTNVFELDSYSDEEEIAKQAENNPLLKRLMLDFLKRADFNISDFEAINLVTPPEVIKDIVGDKELSEELKERIEEALKLTSYRAIILFTHETNGKKFQLSLASQSLGTRVYFRLARLLFELKNDGCILLEDELGNSLHYDLVIHFLETYLQTESKAQLLFSTHNQLLLDEDWMVRRDMVWFIEKARETASSSLYRASDMELHENASLLNAYSIGKLGAKPIVGSALLSAALLNRKEHEE